MLIRWSEQDVSEVGDGLEGKRVRTGRKEAGFLVVVVDGGHVTGDELEVGLGADVVSCHFEHAKMEIGHRAEGAAGDESDGGFGAVTKGVTEPVGRQLVAGH
jgi:hypothetical protein